MDEQALRRAAEVLSGASEVALACHVNPDADALGAMLGLSAFLRRRGVVTVCSYGNEPLETPRWATLLPGSGDLVPPSAFPSVPAVMVTCDCASFDRLGSLGSAAAQAAEVIWIDHHRSHDGSGTIRLVDGDASSTCELVVRLIEAMGGPLDRDVAICLYAGLVTDTGRFQYQATTPETLRIAATLREHDFDHAELVRALYEDQEPGALRLLGTALGRMARVPEADVIWTYVTRSDMAEAGYSREKLISRDHSPAFDRLMEAEYKRAKNYYTRARNLVDFRDRPALLPAEVMAHVYEGLLDEIKARGFRVLFDKTSLPGHRKLALAFRAWLYCHGF